MAICVLFSGGADSTYALKKVLEDTDQQIHALHIAYRFLPNVVSRQQQAMYLNNTKAADIINRHLQQIRKFRYDTMIVTTSWDCNSRYVMEETAFYGGCYCRQFPEITAVYAGHNINDEDQHMVDTYKMTLDQRTARQSALINLGAGRDVEYKYFTPTRSDEKQYLQNLWELTWGCNNPQGSKFNECCNKCTTCKEKINA